MASWSWWVQFALPLVLYSRKFQTYGRLDLLGDPISRWPYSVHLDCFANPLLLAFFAGPRSILQRATNLAIKRLLDDFVVASSASPNLKIDAKLDLLGIASLETAYKRMLRTIRTFTHLERNVTAAKNYPDRVRMDS